MSANAGSTMGSPCDILAILTRLVLAAVHDVDANASAKSNYASAQAAKEAGWTAVRA